MKIQNTVFTVELVREQVSSPQRKMSDLPWTNINIWNKILKYTNCPAKHKEEEEKEEEGSVIVLMTHIVYNEDLFLYVSSFCFCFNIWESNLQKAAGLRLLISASSSTPATSVHSAPREYSWASAFIGQYRGDERARPGMNERERDRGRRKSWGRGGGKKNNFCFHKPHMSCTHSPRSQRPNVVVM